MSAIVPRPQYADTQWMKQLRISPILLIKFTRLPRLSRHKGDYVKMTFVEDHLHAAQSTWRWLILSDKYGNVCMGDYVFAVYSK